jgi:hypothetical protein
MRHFSGQDVRALAKKVGEDLIITAIVKKDLHSATSEHDF